MNSLAVWDFSFLSFLIFLPKNMGFPLQETPLFYRSSSEDTPSLLHRYSIASPSFRWSNDGDAMDKRWRNLGVSGKDFPFYLLLINKNQMTLRQIPLPLLVLAFLFP